MLLTVSSAIVDTGTGSAGSLQMDVHHVSHKHYKN